MTDFIQFQDDERGNLLTRCGIGSWPPPEDDVWLVSPLVHPDVQIPCVGDDELAHLAEFWGDTGIEMVVTPFRQISRSQLPDDADFTYVARGALYVPKEDS